MFTVKVDTSGFQRRWRETQVRVNQSMVLAVTKAADAGVAAAKRGRFKDHSGRLRREIHHDAVRKGGANLVLTYMVSATPWAHFVEYGTRPHEIWPKAGHGLIGPLRSSQSRRGAGEGSPRRWLRWYVNGHPVFARMVNHPGTSPYRYMHDGARVAAFVLRQELGTSLFVGLQTIWN